jgi:type II secretory pathway component PulK
MYLKRKRTFKGLKTRSTSGGDRRGVVLIAVLIVVVVLTLAAYQFSDLMTAENRASGSYLRYAQARALAQSGIPYAAIMVSNSSNLSTTLNGNPYSNSSVFQGVALGESTNGRQGRFSVIAPPGPDDVANGNTSYRFGVISENGKINLNALMLLDSSGTTAYNVLMMLPNMTDDIANSIIDWIDADDTPRSNGAESDYYLSLSPPYQAKNGPLDSLEELLLVKGVTPQLLFGNDMNRNGILDPDEEDGTGTLDQGWSAYLTVYSREVNVSSLGTPRIYLNDSDLNNLSSNLAAAVGSDMANFIIAYRMYGPAAQPSSSNNSSGGSGGSGASKTPSTGGSGGAGGNGGAAAGSGAKVVSSTTTATGITTSTVTAANGARTGSMTVTGAGGSSGASGSGGATAATGPLRVTITTTSSGSGNSISSIFSLINAYVTVPSSTAGQAGTTYPSPLNDQGTAAQILPLLLDQTTTVQSAELPARVDVNAASSAVLQALPQITADEVQTILGNRPGPDATDAADPAFSTVAWLYTKANMSPQTLQTLEKYITAGSQVYRIQSVGYFDGGGPSVRVEAVVDTNAGRPRILMFRDLTELGKGYNLQPSP